MKRLIIIGAGGHGKVIADMALLSGYKQVDFLDDNMPVGMFAEYRVLGDSTMIAELAALKCDFVVGIGNALVREKKQKEIEGVGGNIITLIHPSAIVAKDVKIGKGTVAMAKAVIKTGVVIGDGCIINTSASVDCNDRIGNYAHVSGSVYLGENVIIGNKCWVGIGSIVDSNVSICDNCMIGAGAVIVNNLVEVGTYAGVPAKKIK